MLKNHFPQTRKISFWEKKKKTKKCGTLKLTKWIL